MLYKILFFVLSTTVALAQPNMNPDQEYHEILTAYVSGYSPAQLKVDNLGICKDAVESVRNHHFAVFATATGAGLGTFLLAKKGIEVKLRNETAKLSEMDKEIEKVLDKSGNAHESAMESAYKMKRLSADSSDFTKELQNLKSWMNSIDQKTISPKEFNALDFKLAELEQRTKTIQAGKIKSNEIAEQFSKLKAAKASPQEIESVRTLMEAQSRANIKNIHDASKLVNEFVSSSVNRLSVGTYKAEGAALEASRAAQAEKVGSLAKLGKGAKLAGKLAGAATPVIAAIDIANMADNDSKVAYSSISGILNEKTSADFLCKQSRTDETFQKNLTLLTTAKSIDKGTASKVGQNLGNSPAAIPSSIYPGAK